jgi:hypothetical protein
MNQNAPTNLNFLCLFRLPELHTKAHIFFFESEKSYLSILTMKRARQTER